MKTEHDMKSPGKTPNAPAAPRYKVKRSGEGLAAFPKNSEIRGKFIRVKEQVIKDRRTKENKTIRVYSLELKDKSLARIGSRVLLDDAFDEIVDQYFHGNPSELQGQDVSFIRGEDSANANGDEMGTYEIVVW